MTTLDSGAPSRLGSVRHNIKYGVLLIICLILLYFWGIRGMRFFMVPTSSMEPTLLPADYLLTLNEDSYHRGDIVVVEDPADRSGHLVKRIVGVPGDKIHTFDGALFINGQYASEPYTNEPMDYAMPIQTVPDGTVYLLGDNRNYSEDSHIWNAGIEISKIVGRVRFVYLPFERMQRVQHFPLKTVADYRGLAQTESRE